MSINFARPLNTNELAHRFLTRVLGIKKDAGDHSQRVCKAEMLLECTSLKPTIESETNRHPDFSQEKDRVRLRLDIFKELVDMERLDNDEDITFGLGGAKPKCSIRFEKQAYVITGLPASGKSHVASLISNHFGAYIVDSDYAKRKFPEYKQEHGASILHEESTLVTFGLPNDTYENEPCLFEYCVSRGINMVIPKIGHNMDALNDLNILLKSQGYSVHLTLVCLNRIESCRRALERYVKTQRYVPLGLIFDGYGNDPILTYFRLKESKIWDSVGKISTLNLQASGPEYKEGNDSNPAYIFNTI